MNDHREAWLQKARIDYFAPFISLWLACNSWYRAHYSEMSNATDRAFINKLKTDVSGRNHLYTQFKNLLKGDQTRKDIAFKANLEMLHHSLTRANIKPERLLYPCSFTRFLIDYGRKDHADGYVNIICNPKILKSGKLSSSDQGRVYRLDEIYITSDLDCVFSGLIETIYQIRNMVIHGYVRPEKDEHEVVKYCYLILADLLRI